MSVLHYQSFLSMASTVCTIPDETQPWQMLVQQSASWRQDEGGSFLTLRRWCKQQRAPFQVKYSHSTAAAVNRKTIETPLVALQFFKSIVSSGQLLLSTHLASCSLDLLMAPTLSPLAGCWSHCDCHFRIMGWDGYVRKHTM